ncbi:Histone-lysine N-methyltransferase SETMAR [Araneus ventricosus]|uniref:Histone-lysine N-methyltransferase SETMAR n=1 Tax=Araneus ventricosus TaxID=182803 RepID=A0A4Y2C7U8_ARAVE|nr:Histone-lysine N-methyltransferase SETMAR [Araneus ventricosus]
MQEKGEDGCRGISCLSQDCKNDNKPRGALFLDDNARPLTARDTKEHIRRMEWERLDHPAYSPDLAPSDFHLFPALKLELSGRHFRSNEEVHLAVKNFLRSLGTDFYQDGFSKLISRYDKCINAGGEYVER